MLLIWGAGRWFAETPPTPVEQLHYEARPPWLNLLRAFGRWLFVIYAVNLILTLGNTPLLIYSNNVAPAVSINADAMTSTILGDYGQATGPLNRVGSPGDNHGPLVRGKLDYPADAKVTRSKTLEK